MKNNHALRECACLFGYTHKQHIEYARPADKSIISACLLYVQVVSGALSWAVRGSRGAQGWQYFFFGTKRSSACLLACSWLTRRLCAAFALLSLALPLPPPLPLLLLLLLLLVWFLPAWRWDFFLALAFCF